MEPLVIKQALIFLLIKSNRHLFFSINQIKKELVFSFNEIISDKRRIINISPI